jgi:glutathione S-transferase
MMVERIFKPEPVRDEAAAQRAEESLPAILNTIEVSLAGKDFLAGDLFTIGDLNAAAIAGSLTMAGFDSAGFPNLSAWLERCHARPAYQKLQSLRPPR